MGQSPQAATFKQSTVTERGLHRILSTLDDISRNIAVVIPGALKASSESNSVAFSELASGLSHPEA